jgi:hypothetical protein
MGGVRNAYKVLLRKPEGKRQLERTRGGWEFAINMYLRVTGYEGVDWINVAHVGTSCCILLKR